MGRLFGRNRVPELEVLAVHRGTELEARRLEIGWVKRLSAEGPLVNAITTLTREKPRWDRPGTRWKQPWNAPPEIPPGVVWATHLPGARVRLPAGLRRRILEFHRRRDGARAFRLPTSRRTYATTHLLSETATARALEVVQSIRRAGKRVHWARVARLLSREGQGSYHSHDVAHAVWAARPALFRSLL